MPDQRRSRHPDALIAAGDVSLELDGADLLCLAAERQGEGPEARDVEPRVEFQLVGFGEIVENEIDLHLDQRAVRHFGAQRVDAERTVAIGDGHVSRQIAEIARMPLGVEIKNIGRKEIDLALEIDALELDHVLHRAGHAHARALWIAGQHQHVV